MAYVYLRNLTLENGSDPLEGDLQFISSRSGFEFIDQESGEKYKLEWHHLTDGQILEHGQEPESLNGAAAGSLVGFLVAGPLGTAAGGLMGAGNQAKKQRDPIVGFSFDDGRTVVGNFDAKDIQAVQSIIFSAKNTKAPEPKVVARYASVNNMTKTCTGCVEEIHLKATKCKHCGLGFDLKEIESAIREILHNTTCKACENNYGGDWVLKRTLSKTIVSRFVPELTAEDQLELTNYLNLIIDRHFEDVLTAAAEKKGCEPSAFFQAVKGGPDVEDFVDTWKAHGYRIPGTEDLWGGHYDVLVQNNWGLIFDHSPSDALTRAKVIGYILVYGGWGAANSFGPFFSDGFDFLVTPNSRLYVGDERLQEQMLMEFDSLGFTAHRDPYCLNKYPNIDIMKDQFDCSVDERHSDLRITHAKSLGLLDVFDSLVEREFLNSVRFFEEEYAKSAEASSQEIETDVSNDDDTTVEAPTLEENQRESGPNFFVRLWKTVWYGGVNFILWAVLWSFALATDQTLLLVLLLANVVTSSARLFAYKKWDYWFFLFLCGLGVVALAMSFSGNPLSEFIQPQ